VADHGLALVEGLDPLPSVVVLDASAIPDLEFTALQALAGLNEELHSRGVVLWLAGLHRVPREMVQRALAVYEGPSAQLWEDVEAAVAAFEEEAR